MFGDNGWGSSEDTINREEFGNVSQRREPTPEKVKIEEDSDRSFLFLGKVL